MISLICNSGISFFNHYISTFRNFKELEFEKYYINENLVGNFKNYNTFITTRSLKSMNMKDIFAFRRYLQFYKTVKNSGSNKFHFISVHPTNVFQILLLKLLNRKVISTIHDLKPHPDWKSKIINLIQKFIIILSDEIILHNQKDVNELKNSHFIPLSGYELNLQNKNFNKNLLFFGRIEDYKGLKNIRSLLEESQYIRDNWSVTIAGKGFINTDFSQFNNVKLINRFISDDELMELHQNAALCFMPYDSATQSAVILHSLSLGTPILAHDVGSIGEYMADWTGYLVKHNDFDNIEDILKNFSEQTSKFFFSQIQEKYPLMYSLKAIEKNYLNIYRI